jgi:hypothetical protein
MIENNIIYYNSTKYKQITRDILVLEIYNITRKIYKIFVINITLKTITDQLGFIVILIIIYINSYSFYEYLIKLGITKKKRLIIDIIAIR